MPHERPACNFCQGVPLLKALEIQLPRLCSLPYETQAGPMDPMAGPMMQAARCCFPTAEVELFGGSSLRRNVEM